MAGILYLIICTLVGIGLNRLYIRGLDGFCLNSFGGKSISVNKYLLIIPAGFLTGLIFVTWPVYLWASLLKDTASPLGYANLIVLTLYTLILVPVFVWKYLHDNKNDNREALLSEEVKPARKFSPSTVIYLVVALLLCITLMYTSFVIIDNKYYIGLTVFSDFSPHVGMIRSFSYGNNYGPTIYEICAGKDIRYHFMFQFLVGNLEFLGLRIDHAFNIPSILCLFCVFIFLYILGYMLSGKKAVGILAGVLLTFRSSFSLFGYLGGFSSGEEIIEALKTNSEFIGSTAHEDWGLWNLNVFCNQRHISFGLALILLLVLLFIPYVFKGFSLAEEEKGFLRKFKAMFLSAGAWRCTDIKKTLFLGVLIGGLGFFNGACLIGGMIILFFMAIPSSNKLDHLILAIIAGALSLLQTNTFINGQALGFDLYFGFLSDNPTFVSSLIYLVKLTGLFIFVISAAFVIGDKVRRYFTFAFFMPVVFAFTVSLTPDIAVNHKYIIIAVMFLNIFVADVIVRIFEQKQIAAKLSALLLVLVMTSTGVFDFVVLSRLNTLERAIVLNVDDPLELWVRDNLTSKDVVVSGPLYLNGGRGSYLITGGAMLYMGWPYFGWSAGYDTYTRDDYIRDVFGAPDEAALKAAVKKTGCTYICVDAMVRDDSAYNLNEALIDSVYQLVYSEGDGHDSVNIYKVSQSY